MTRLQISSGESTKILENLKKKRATNTYTNKYTDLVLHVRTNVMCSIFICRPTVLTRLEIRTLNIVRSNLERLIRTLPKKKNSSLSISLYFTLVYAMVRYLVLNRISNYFFFIFHLFSTLFTLHTCSLFISYIWGLSGSILINRLSKQALAVLQCIHNFKFMKICQMFVKILEC